ncbi:unnamed protein product [Spirodela intermedia]|uniref:Dirigent protein n=1 Tax=Spirodela intermedia TaxID=51605 RepID=A0A7I8IRA7_SPIIN|nr:unnamed protein product [Spirodela intermedia]CAA6660333.1 unnamed protein product [Spirodela intermedia]
MASLRASSVWVCLFLLVAAVNGQDDFDIGEERKTHLNFFFHDIVSGPNATAVAIVQSSVMNSTAGRFGLVVMVDNALTEGPNISSKLIGRAQGFYATASQGDLALLMTMNFYFIDGVYNGSTLAILGRNSAASQTREISVVGGTGYFRLAQGYAIAKTGSWNATSGDAVVEYDVYVVHKGPASASTSNPGGAPGSGQTSAGSRSTVYFPVLLLLQAAYFLCFLGH